MSNVVKRYSQSGSIYTLSALVALFVLVPLTSLVVDAGYLFVVKRELQNAADSAALAGANQLMPPTSTGQPNWSRAQTKALESIRQNPSLGLVGGKLSDGTVESGYWDKNPLNPGFIALSSITTLTTTMVPAIKVIVKREGAQNQGPVSLFFSGIFNIDSSPVAASAVSAVRRPKGLGTGSSLPIGVKSCAMSTAWDSTTSQPKSPPVPIRIGENLNLVAGYSPCYGGTWLSMSPTISASATRISEMIGRSDAIAIGDISLGSETAVIASIYPDITACIANNNCEKTALPVVDQVSTGTFRVSNLVCLIPVATCCGGGSCTRNASGPSGGLCPGSVKYVEFQLTTGCRVERWTDGSTADNTYSVYEPARLNQ